MKYKLTKDNLNHILKVAGFTIASAVVASLIGFLGDLEIAPQYMFIVSVVNILFVSLKEYLNKNR